MGIHTASGDRLQEGYYTHTPVTPCMRLSASGIVSDGFDLISLFLWTVDGVGTRFVLFSRTQVFVAALVVEMCERVLRGFHWR